MFQFQTCKIFALLLVLLGLLVGNQAFILDRKEEFSHLQPFQKQNYRDAAAPKREKRSFDIGGLVNYAMRTFYSLTTYPYPYPSLYGQGYGQRLINPILVQKFGPAGFAGAGGFGNRYNNRYSYSPGSYSTFHATRGYGFH